MSFDLHSELNKFASAFVEVVRELKMERKKVLITTHRFLDGDAFGSAVALGLILRKFNVDATLLCIPFIPYKLRFLSSIDKLHIVEPFRADEKDIRDSFTDSLSAYFSGIIDDYGALAMVDCAGFAQVPEEAWAIGRGFPYKINIDHHVGYEFDCPIGQTLNLVGNYCSTSEVIFHFIKAIGLDLYPEIAVPLYTGVISDLRKNEIPEDSPNFPKDALKELHSQAKKIGFDLRRLVKTVFALDSWEKCLLKMTLAEKRFVDNIVYLKFDRDMIFKAKEATDSLDNSRMPFHEFHIRLRRRLRRFRKDFQIVVIFDQILGKVSLHKLQREAQYDLASIGRQMGDGGGHENRAGFTFESAKEKLLASGSISEGLSDDIIMEKIIEAMKTRL